MALCELRFFSQTIQKCFGMNVILPTKGRGPWPVFYLLHGLSDDHTIWHRHTSIERYVAEWPMIIVMPDGLRNFYTNSPLGNFTKYIGEEIPTFIETHFHAMKSRAGRCIGGLSMGGYGALRVGLEYPDRFASLNSHSGALMHGSKTWPAKANAEYNRIFGTRPAGTDHDLLSLAATARRGGGKLPKILLDCGTDDFLIADNRAFHARLTAMRIEHQYAEYPGAHTWAYWDQHVREALAFHGKNLKLKHLPPG